MSARNIPATRKSTAARKATAEAPEATTPVEAAEPQATPEEGTEHPYAYLLEKDPTSLHTNYQTWLQEVTGETMSERDLKIIQMVCVTRMAFQRSEANQKELQSRKAQWAKAQEAKKAESAKRKVEQLKKLAAETGLNLKDLLSA